MRKLLLHIIFFLFLFSCEKETAETPLIGQWDWIMSRGGWGESTSEETGDQIVIEFTKDSVYREFFNDTLLIETSFYLINSEAENLIMYKNMMPSQSYDFKADTLILHDKCIDCFTSEYKRINYKN